MNLLYLSDYINYYSVKSQKYVKFVPYKNTLKNGLIIDANKFIKSFNRMLKEYNIKTGIVPENILIITPPNFYSINKYIYKNIFENLNYKGIRFKSEIDFYDIEKNNVMINYNKNYFYLSKIIQGKIKSEIYPNNLTILNLLIKENNSKNIFIHGLLDDDLKSILRKNSANYYTYEFQNNYFIEKLVKD